MFGKVRRKFGDAAKNVAQGVAQDVAQEEVASKYVGSGYSGHSDLLGKPENYAYWHLLRKFTGNVVLIHIPTIKHADKVFEEKMRSALSRYCET